MALTEDELRTLLVDLESDLVERKSSLDTDRASHAICAFSNDLPGHERPGVLFLGVDDAGVPTGLEVTDQLLLDVAGLRDRGTILPTPSLVVRVLSVRDRRIVAVEVQPGLTPPVRYKGVVWIRVGPRRAMASPDEERRLSERRRSLDLPFDARPMQGVALEDLDVELFRRVYLPSAVAPDVLAENGRTEAEQLASLRLADLHGTPTTTGLLLLGISPREHLPGAYLQFLHIGGQSLSDPIRDDKVLDGPLIDVLRQLDEILALNITTTVDVRSSPELRRPDYPLVALQQLCRNAVMHRTYEGTNAPVRMTWYSDRVEIWSPGGPFGLVTETNFGQPGVTDYRNPNLAGALRSLGYVQRFGVGVETARRACRDNGNAQPVFEVRPEYVAVTVRKETT